jgi:hypothetical protein
MNYNINVNFWNIILYLSLSLIINLCNIFKKTKIIVL